MQTLIDTRDRAARDDFEKLLGTVSNLKSLETETATIYGLRPDLTLAYVNPGWRRFARENGGEPAINRHWGLGCRVLDAMSRDAAEFYRQRFQQCLASGREWSIDYESSSATTLRVIRLRVLSLGPGEGLLTIHSPIVLAPHSLAERRPFAALNWRYENDDREIAQCVNCRRTASLQPGEGWHWVPAWVDHPPQGVAYRFCPLCLAYYTGLGCDSVEPASADSRSALSR